MGKLVSGLEYKLFITRDTVNGLILILIEFVKSKNRGEIKRMKTFYIEESFIPEMNGEL